MYEFEHNGVCIRPVRGFISELRKCIPVDAKNFLEWGSGCSTLLFQEIARKRGGRVLTLDHTPDYLESLSTELDPAVTRWECLDLIGSSKGQRDPGLNYGTFPLGVDQTFDFILIDGRRRVECSVTAHSVSSPHTVTVLHDYRRERYQAMSVLWDFIDGRQFRMLKKRC